MHTLRIQPVDFEDPACTDDFLNLLDHYMRSPSGTGKPMPAELRTRLPTELRKRPTVLSFVAYPRGLPSPGHRPGPADPRRTGGFGAWLLQADAGSS